ncbi:AsmA family protein [Puniceicoccus vermicola]|uniref:AsmA family protein n=1 Tax=Puniceicoccus vermicola TaxID=388746 RepID=A0A7X1B023_9BACT|nr:hypothetical protein [Puniceicoccus vermicola]MBC2603077.1 hypothetical protein [Puniceicoccus vermicola]
MRKFLLWLTALFVLLLVLVGVLLIPAAQKSLFLAFASNEERTVSVDYIHLGPGGLKLENLEFAGSGILARVPMAEAKFSWGALLDKRLKIQYLRVEDLFVKMEESEKKQKSTDESKDEGFEVPRDFEGILGQSSPIEIQELSVTGKVSTPTNDEMAFSISGADIVPGKRGLLQLSLQPSEGALETLPQVEISIPVQIAQAGELESIMLSGEIVSRVKEAPGVLDLSGSVKPTETGEAYRIEITSEKLLSGGEISLVGNWAKEANQLGLELTAKGDNLDFLQSFVSQPLPAVSFRVKGMTELSPGEGFRSADLRFLVDADKDVLPQFGEPIRAEGVVKVSAGEDSFTFEEFDVSVAPPQDAQPWVALHLLEPQVFRTTDPLEIPQNRFASVDIFIPNQFLNSLTEEWNFSDFKAKSSFVGSEDGVVLESAEPWEVSVRRAGEMSQPVQLSILPHLTYQDDGLNASAEIQFEGEGKTLEAKVSADAGIASLPAASFKASLKGYFGAVATLAPNPEDIPKGLVSSEWTGSFGENLEVSGAFSVTELVSGSMGPADVNLKVREFSLSQQDPMTVKGILDLDWASQGRASSVSGLSLNVVQQENDRWALTVDQGMVVADPRAFNTTEAPSSSTTGASHSPADSGLPDVALLEGAMDLPSMPIDLLGINLKGRILMPEGDRDFEISLADWVPAQEGSFALDLNSAGKQGVNAVHGKVAGQVRFDEAGFPNRVKASAWLKDVPVGEETMPLYGELTFSPDSPVDPIVFLLRTSEDGVPILQAKATIAEDRATATAEADFANWLKSPLRKLIPNVATGHLKADAALSSEGVSSRVVVDALTPLDGFESYDLNLNGMLSSLTPLSAKGGLVLNDAKDKKSDLNVVADGDLEKSLKLNLEGNRLDLEALEGFARVWSGAGGSDEISEKTEPGQTSGPEGNATWPLESMPFEVDGSFSIGQVVPKDMPSIKALDGRFFANTEKATVRVSADWLENSSMSMEGRLARNGEKVEANVDAKVNNLPTGELLQQMNPRETPAIEGLATVGASFQGSAGSLEDLPNWMVGTLQVGVKDGVIRSLKPEARVTKFVNAGSIAGALLGSSLKRPGVSALGEITNLFKEIPFSKLSATLERTDERETVVDSILMLGAYFSMQGSGKVESGDLDQIPVTPMQLRLNLGSKPPLTEPLGVLALLGPNTDANGYREWKQPIEMTGTLAKPDVGELWGMLIGAVERAATMSEKDLAKERQAQGLEPAEKKKKPSTEEQIEQGVNSILQMLGR